MIPFDDLTAGLAVHFLPLEGAAAHQAALVTDVTRFDIGEVSLVAFSSFSLSFERRVAYRGPGGTGTRTHTWHRLGECTR